MMVLAALQRSRSQGITELSAALDLAPSTVHGIVKALESHGLVEKEPRGSRYMLGPGLLNLSTAYLNGVELRSRSIRWATELSRRTGFSSRVAVRLGASMIIILHVPRPDGSEQLDDVGRSIPLESSALGKALVAYQDDSTIGDDVGQRSELNEIATSGIARDPDATEQDESEIASPLVDGTGLVVGSLSVAVSRREWPASDLIVDSLRETARNISRELGSFTWPPARPRV